MDFFKSPHVIDSSHDDEHRGRRFYQKRRFWKILTLSLVVILIFRYCTSTSKNQAPKGQPVVLATAQSKDVPVYLSGLGSVSPEQSITVRTQVNGELMRVLFDEGQMVKKGQLIAEIDPRPYQALLLQYEGQLEHDTALLQNALLDLKRYKKLWAQNSIAKQVYDTQASLVKQTEGTVKTDMGLIAATKLNITYTRITSPVDGKIGIQVVDEGNYVQPSDVGGIVVINTLTPTTVLSTIPEDNIPDILEQLNAGKKLKVLAYDRSQTKLIATGTLSVLDNQVDPTTGTVKLRSDFSNDKNNLYPNQFVNVSVLIKTLKNATVVPTAAIQHGTQGDYIYVINDKPDTKKASGTDDMTVKSVPVISGVSMENETAITKGIHPGDKVVVEGADKLTDGMAVYVAGSKPPKLHAFNRTHSLDLA